MEIVKNYCGEPIQVMLLNGKFADIPAEQCPFTISDKQSMRKVVSLAEDAEFIIHGNIVSITGDNGFPPIRPNTYYIVTKEAVNVLRKIGRGASDLLIPVKTKSGYYSLHLANTITELSEDEATSRFVHQTLLNSLHPSGVVKYDSSTPKVSLR